MTDAAFAALLARRTSRLQPDMARAWLRAIAILRRSLDLNEITRLIESGAFDAILSDAEIDRALLPLRAELRAQTESAFGLSVPLIKGALVDGVPGIAFDVLSPRVRTALQLLERQILTTAKVEVRETVRQAVLAGVEQGKNPREIARGVRSVIGLAPNQERAVRNYEDALRAGDVGKAKGYQLRDKRFDRSMAKGPLSEAQIEKMVAAYRRKFEAFHAETIARTATLNAYRTGQHAAEEAAIAAGILKREERFKVWVNSGDSRVRDMHLNQSTGHPTSVGGEVVPFDALFSNGLLYPSEWNCRCHVRYITKRGAP